MAEAGAGKQTQGVKTLLGDPKKAIIKLSIPMVVAMSAHTIYNVTDAIWVAGLGPESLAAVGFIFPFFFMAMAVASGVGIGLYVSRLLAQLMNGELDCVSADGRTEFRLTLPVADPIRLETSPIGAAAS